MLQTSYEHRNIGVSVLAGLQRAQKLLSVKSLFWTYAPSLLKCISSCLLKVIFSLKQIFHSSFTIRFSPVLEFTLWCTLRDYQDHKVKHSEVQKYEKHTLLPRLNLVIPMNFAATFPEITALRGPSASLGVQKRCCTGSEQQFSSPFCSRCSVCGLVPYLL